jgi:uncharacterized protein
LYNKRGIGHLILGGMKKIDNRKDLMLLMLYSSGKGEAFNEPIIGRTRLVKMIFLFKEEFWHDFKKGTDLTDDKFYEFRPWHYGPFSKEVYEDLTFFSLRDFIELRPSNEETLIESAEELNYFNEDSGIELDNTMTEYQDEEIKLTPSGVEFTKELYESLNGNQKTTLKKFKSKLSQMQLRAILFYVYKQYPSQITNSKIKRNILGS